MSHATPYAISWPVGVSIFVYVMIQYLSIQPIFLQIVYSICRCIGSVFVNSTDISTNIETAVLSRWQLCWDQRDMIFHITHVYIFPHLQEEGNLLDQCARVHVFKSRIISSACFHPDDDVHWGKANFAHTPAFQRFEGVFTRTHVYLWTASCPGPWKSNYRGLFHILVKNFIIPMKNRKLMFFSGPDAGSLLSGTVKRSSEARCFARLKRQNIWSHFSRHNYHKQDVRSYSITQYSIDQIVNSIF